MRLNILLVAGLVVVVLLGLVIIWEFKTQTRIAYVRSYDLINKYQGTLEARASFESKKANMLSSVDSLRSDFERDRNAYFLIMNTLGSIERAKREELLNRQQSHVIQYTSAIEQKIQEEDAKMMQEVLNQVNSFIEQYAIQMDYDLILGTTSSGSLLFGSKELDITNSVLDDLNKQFKGR